MEMPGYYDVLSTFGEKFNIGLGQEKVCVFVIAYIEKYKNYAGSAAFCGFSNAKIADILQVSLATVKRAVRFLKEQGLIAIDHAGTFARRIRLNFQHAFFAEPETEPVKSQPEPEKDSDTVDAGNTHYASDEECGSACMNVLSNAIPDLTDWDKKKIRKDILPLYTDYLKHGGSLDTLKAHFDHLSSYIGSGHIENAPKYLRKSFLNFRETGQITRKQPNSAPAGRKKPVIADGSTLSEWYKQTECTPASPELVAHALAMQKEIFGKNAEE